MDIVRLPRGKRAANNVDCIHVEPTDDGRFDLTGSMLANCAEGADSAESVALISGATFDSEAAAEAAGIAWANEQCVPLLYVSRGDHVQ